MFQLSHKFNAFLGENKKKPTKQKMTTNNKGKRNKERKKKGRKAERKKHRKVADQEHSCNGNDNVVYQKISIKKKRNRGRGNKTKKERK